MTTSRSSLRRSTGLSSARFGLVALASLAISPWAMADEPKVLGDRDFFTKDSFIAYAAPWSTDTGAGQALKHGVDFADEIAVQPEKFPADTELTWHWPLTASKNAGVYGYNALSFGNYDGGVPQVPITPRQVKEIGTLAETFGFQMARPIGDFNVLNEFFLTKTAGGDKVAEIGFFPHPSRSAVVFADAGEQLGSFTDPSGQVWKVGVQPAPYGPYYMFIPAADVLTGSIDFKAALDFLKTKGKLTGDEWFHGLAFGIEPVIGSGSIRVQSLSVTYK